MQVRKIELKAIVAGSSQDTTVRSVWNKILSELRVGASREKRVTKTGVNHVCLCESRPQTV